MADRNPPASGPFGPAPTSPPTRVRAQPYVDHFLGLDGSNPSDPPRRGREGIWVALAAFVGAALVIAGIAWFSQRDGDEVGAGSGDASEATVADRTPGTEAAPDDEQADEVVPEQSTPDEDALQEPAPGSEVDGAPCPAGTPEPVCDAAAFVEQTRGRPFKEFPVVEFAEEGDFQERLLEDVDSGDIAETEREGRVLGSLGLIPVGTDLVEVTRQSLEIGVVGFYDPTSNELVVRGSDLDLFVELVIVHELVHAHDDQWLDLDRPEVEEADDEQFVGFLAVVEGNASRVESLWRDQLSGAERDELSRLERALFDADDIRVLQQIPSFVLELQFFPYNDGPALVRRIATEAGGGAEGERAVDDAIRNPPRTSEQALHPDQFINREEAPTVPEPSAAGEIVDHGVIGELGFDLWLGDRVGDGWNGDRYVSFDSGDMTCTVVHVAADTDDDFDEIIDAAADWVGDAGDGDLRQSETATIDGVDLVIIEGCR